MYNFQEDESGSARAAEAAFRTVPRDHTTFLVWRVTVIADESPIRHTAGL